MNLTSPALLERPTPPTLDKRSVEELRSEPPRPLGPQDGPALRLTPLVAVVVALAALMAFAGTLAFEFVWDDTLLIQRSYQLHDWRDLWPALATHFWAEVQEASHYYRPFITFTFFLDLQVWGLNPLGFHLTNVLAHLATSLAVLALAWRLTRRRVAAGGAGVLFALHPLHSESVAFVSGRTDIFATLFFLTAVLGYARWRDTGRPLWAAGSLAAFFLALTSKEVAVVLPLVLALYDWARDRRRPGRAGPGPDDRAVHALRRRHRSLRVAPAAGHRRPHRLGRPRVGAAHRPRPHRHQDRGLVRVAGARAVPGQRLLPDRAGDAATRRRSGGSPWASSWP